MLKRLRIRFKRARFHVHSPDPDYERKRLRILEVRHTVCTTPSMRLLYLDEVTLTRQPTLASDWCTMDRNPNRNPNRNHATLQQAYGQPLAEMSCRPNHEFRVLGALDGCSGQLHWITRAHIRVPTLRDFFVELVRRYPFAERLYVVVDNWPVHYHPNVLVHLIEQPFAADFVHPAFWPTKPTQSPPAQPLPLVLVPLPTYSPWLNPIEKVWGLCRKHVTHLHRHADDVDGLKAAIADYFEHYAAASDYLLKAVGLLQG